jgi:AcrR family transcriptional regulator
MPARKPLRKSYHHGDLREQLLLAGETALAAMPAEHVSLREIARRAGVSHAAPRHHFATLGELLAEIAARGFDRFVAHLGKAADEAHDQSPRGRLFAMGRAYLDFAQRNPAVYGLMFGKNEQGVRSQRLGEAAARAWTQLESHVAACAGEAKAQSGALLVWSYVHGLAMLRLAMQGPPPLLAPNAFEASFAVLIDGVDPAI